MDDLESDGKDDCKRRSRNLSEKKRRDQFNVLINELCSIVSSTRRKLDKSSVLKATVAFLRTHNEVSARSQCCEIQEIWKPIFLCNEEFTHIMLEALDGFIMVMSSSSKLLYVSESVTTLLGYQTAEISATPFYELILEDDKHKVYYILHNPSSSHFLPSCKNQDVSPVVFTCHMKKKSVRHEEIVYELVRFQGFYLLNDKINHLANKESNASDKIENRICFVAMGRLIHPQLLKDVSLKSGKSEFTSRHSLEWKFLFLDHRAPPIIGYLPFEVLGTSGYDYYHADDLEKICSGHEQLMLTGEGTSCPYRFLSKGQQWVWLQTHYYITYHQWTSKPEFIVSTHTVIVSNKANMDFLYEDYSHCGSSQSRKLDLFERRKGRSSSKGQKQIPSRQGCQSSLDSVYPKYVLSSPSSSVVSSQDSSGLDAASDQCVDKVPNEDMMNNESGSQYLQNEDYGINAVMSSDEIIQSSQPVPVMESRVMQDHLKQRYTEIQDQIARQQEELQQIQEQLINVQYGYTPHSAPGQLPQEQCSPMSSQIMYPSANERVSPNYGLRSMQCQVPGPDWTNNCEEFTLMDQIQVQSDAYPRM